MLKLTRSFYRFLPHTCDHISFNISHVKAFSHLIINSETCKSVLNQSISLNSLIHNSLQWQQVANTGKRFKINKPFVGSNATAEKMSESFRPSLTHGSYGGQFQVDAVDEDESWIQHEDPQAVENNQEGNDNNNTKMKYIRMWEPAYMGRNQGEVGGVKFKIMSYNVLAQCLLESHSHLYADCSPENLEWDVRSARIFEEVLNVDPDILCLQEVQQSHMASFFSRFEDIGYTGVYKQKTGQRQDGCAIYFKQSMFHLEEYINVEFNQPSLPLLNRDNVGIAVRLRALPDMGVASAYVPPIVVATTHLLYNPKRTDVRLAQIQLFLAEVDRFAYCMDGTVHGHYPIIMTGDLNSTPGSPVIELLSKRKVSALPYRDNSDWREIGVTDNCQHLAVFLNRLQGLGTTDSMLKIHISERFPAYIEFPLELREVHANEAAEAIIKHSDMFNSGILENPLHLTSVYDHRRPDGSNEATTFQTSWITVDYMYFSCSRYLNLVKRLRLPNEAECKEMGPLPNQEYASDHLALAATFELKAPEAHL